MLGGRLSALFLLIVAAAFAAGWTCVGTTCYLTSNVTCGSGSCLNANSNYAYDLNGYTIYSTGTAITLLPGGSEAHDITIQNGGISSSGYGISSSYGCRNCQFSNLTFNCRNGGSSRAISAINSVFIGSTVDKVYAVNCTYGIYLSSGAQSSHFSWTSIVGGSLGMYMPNSISNILDCMCSCGSSGLQISGGYDNSGPTNSNYKNILATCDACTGANSIRWDGSCPCPAYPATGSCYQCAFCQSLQQACSKSGNRTTLTNMTTTKNSDCSQLTLNATQYFYDTCAGNATVVYSCGPSSSGGTPYCPSNATSVSVNSQMCPVNTTCQLGQCVLLNAGNCTNACSPGQSQCNGTLIQACGQNASGCWVWAAPANCSGGQVCSQGNCTLAPNPCAGSKDPCCGSSDLCCGQTAYCCSNPTDACCASNPGNTCCGSTDACCNASSYCCSHPSDSCCAANPQDPCCGSTDPCCGKTSYCCSNPADSCCSLNPGNACCGSTDACCNPNAPCCVNPQDPCCTDPSNPFCQSPRLKFDTVTTNCIQPGTASTVGLILRNIGFAVAQNTSFTYSCFGLPCNGASGPVDLPSSSHFAIPVGVSMPSGEGLGLKPMGLVALSVENGQTKASASLNFYVQACVPANTSNCSLQFGPVSNFGLCPGAPPTALQTSLANIGNESCYNITLSPYCDKFLSCNVSQTFIANISHGNSVQLELAVSSPANDTFGIKNISISASPGSAILRASANTNACQPLTSDIFMDGVSISPDAPDTNSALNCSAIYHTLLDNHTADIYLQFWRRPNGTTDFYLYSAPGAFANLANNTTVSAPLNNAEPLGYGDWWKCSARACEPGRTTNCSQWENSTPVYVGWAYSQNRFVEVFPVSPEAGQRTEASVSFYYKAVSPYTSNLSCQLRTDGLQYNPVNCTSGIVKIESYGGFVPGEHTWGVNCTDATNATGQSETRTFTSCTGSSGTSAPSVTLNSPADGQNVGGSASLSWTARDDSDANLQCSIFLDGKVYDIVSAQNGAQKTYVINPLPAGAHAWRVDCMDSNCNLGKSAERLMYTCSPDPARCMCGGG